MFRGKYNFKVLTYELEYDDLPEAFEGFKITQISNFSQKKIEIPPKINIKYPYLNDSILKMFIAQGKIDFIKSDTKLDSCKTYHINIVHHEDSLLKVANCKKKLIVIKAKLP